MTRWKVLFWIMFTVSIITYGLYLPPILSNTDNYIYYSNRKLLKTEASNPEDVDYSSDIDNDGLTDYEEVHKYLTDPQNKDSDNDGKVDSDWGERYEFTRTYKAVVDLREPYSLSDMNDFYQDARLVEVISNEVSRFEVILYPDAKEVIVPFAYDSFKNIESEYTRNSFSKNLSSSSRNKIIRKVRSSKTELEALIRLQWEFNLLMKVDIESQLGYTTDNPLQFQYYFNELGATETKYSGYPTTYTMDEILDRVYFAEGMYKNRTRGVCSSSATIRGSIFRAGGLEERTIFTIPLFYTTPEDATEVNVENMPRKNWLNTKNMVDHFFNEVKIGYRWVRVDTNIIDTGVYAPYIKLLSTHDQAYHNWDIWSSGEKYFNNRPYIYVSITEQFPKYGPEGN